MTSGFQMVFLQKVIQFPTVRRNIENTAPADKSCVSIGILNIAGPAPFTYGLNIGLLLFIHCFCVSGRYLL